MKTLRLFLAAVVLTLTSVKGYSQNAAPATNPSKSGLDFQGYAIDQDGKALASQKVNVTFTIYNKLNGAQFVETQSITTDKFGVFVTVIGYKDGASVTNFNNISSINFTDNIVEWLKVDVAKDGSSILTEVSNAPFTTVPYAKRADNGVPPGTIMAFAGTEIPEGWFICDGRGKNKDIYPELFAAIGTKWGNMNGNDFPLPNLSGKFLRGANGSTDVNPDQNKRTRNGSEIGSTDDEVGSAENHAFTSHIHDVKLTAVGDHSHGFNKTYFNGEGATTANMGFGHPDKLANLPNNGSTTDAGGHNHTVSESFKGTSTEVRPVNMAVLWIIKY